jgi:hypothetical protein
MYISSQIVETVPSFSAACGRPASVWAQDSHESLAITLLTFGVAAVSLMLVLATAVEALW